MELVNSVAGNSANSGCVANGALGERKANVEQSPKTRSSRGVARVLMVVIGVNRFRIGVGGEGRNDPSLADRSG